MMYSTPIKMSLRLFLVLLLAGLLCAIANAQQVMHAPNTDPGIVGTIGFSDTAQGGLKGLGDDDDSSYHTYIIEIDEGVESLVVSMSADDDLDLALKHAEPIESYGDDADWDLGDNSVASSATLRIDNPSAGKWYIDVINSLRSEATVSYELTVE